MLRALDLPNTLQSGEDTPGSMRIQVSADERKLFDHGKKGGGGPITKSGFGVIMWKILDRIS